MSMKPRTIDNLGMDVSVRYAKDKQLAEPHLAEEAKFVAQKTEVSVLKPYVSLEFEQLFSLGKTVSWALFTPPPDYYAGNKPLFSYQLIPSLGDYEKQETDDENAESIEDVLKKPRKKQEGNAFGGGSAEDDAEEERERQILLSLFQCIHQLDKTLSLINSRRNQYQRG